MVSYIVLQSGKIYNKVVLPALWSDPVYYKYVLVHQFKLIYNICLVEFSCQIYMEIPTSRMLEMKQHFILLVNCP